jgi:hypothetical protein
VWGFNLVSWLPRNYFGRNLYNIRLFVLFNHVVENPIRYHYPFYRIDEIRNRPSFIGSGILAKFGDLHFVLSAAHVFDELGSSLCFPEAGIEAPVEVEVTTSPIPASGRDSDFLDVAIAHLPHEVASLLERRFNFIEVCDLLLDDVHEDGKRYCFTGFPATRTGVRYPARAIDVDCYEYRLDSRRITSECAPWHPALHLAGEFRRDEMRVPGGNRITAPEPNGMSGGGVWVLDASGSCKLVGIGINWDGNLNALIGVRIGAWSCFLRQRYPEFNSFLPLDSPIQIRFEG